jgi:uncharacterized membrane protein
VGTISGLFSFLNATVPMFKDPLVAILPRIFIGVTAFFAYRSLRRLGTTWMLLFCTLLLGLVGIFVYEIAQSLLWLAILTGVVGVAAVSALVFCSLRGQVEVVALSVAAAVGTLTNTILVLIVAVLRGYMVAGVAVGVGLTHGVPEIVVAAILTVAIVVAWKRLETGRGEAQM